MKGFACGMQTHTHTHTHTHTDFLNFSDNGGEFQRGGYGNAAACGSADSSCTQGAMYVLTSFAQIAVVMLRYQL